MSKESALRFIMIKEKDEKIKKASDAIMSKYEGKNLSADEMDKAIREEVIPLAKKFGYDISPEDLAEPKKTDGKISEEELGQVVGGRGQFTVVHGFVVHGFFSRGYKTATTNACDKAPDDQTFRTYFDQLPTSCPDYAWIEEGSSMRCCAGCKYLQSSTSSL